ncbi:MAG: hypothetical protein QM763_15550 [Agriterribacter sp.]
MLFLLFAYFGNAQLIQIDGREYIDTARGSDTGNCKTTNIYYYQVDGKYPENSYTLLHAVTTYLDNFELKGLKNGYITFRFTIDCKGQLVRFVEVLQTNELYKKAAFEIAFLNKLYQYIRTLKDWKKATLKNSYPCAYKAFLTFKIKDGKVDNIIP